MERIRLFTFVFLIFLSLPGLSAEEALKVIKLEVNEVTQPDISVSKDRQWIYFNLLGHVFRIPSKGGEATQLTFGPYYDSNPEISPDGTKLVFVSDRDASSNGNLFLLNLETREIKQLTTNTWAVRPTWSEDGSRIAYLRYKPLGLWSQYEFIAPMGVSTEVREIRKDGTEDQAISSGFDFHTTVAYSGNTLYWTVVNPEHEKSPASTEFISLRPGREPVTLFNIEGVVDRFLVLDKSIVARKYQRAAAGVLIPQQETFIQLSLDGTAQKEIAALLSPQPRPKFAVSGESIIYGEAGKIRSVTMGGGESTAVEFRANAEMTVYPVTPAPPFKPLQAGSYRTKSVLSPRLSSDQETIYYTMDGFVWSQPIKGGEAQRVIDSASFEWGPAAISPEGGRLLYQSNSDNKQSLKIKDLSTGRDTSLVESDTSGRFEPVWSPDGKSVAYVGFDGALPSIYIIELATKKTRKLIDTAPRWMPRPQYSRDGSHIFYTDRNQLWKVDVTGGKPQPLTNIREGHVTDATVSPNGKWIAFRRNNAIWTAPISDKLVSDQDVGLFSELGGWNFSFSPDSAAIVYSDGATLRKKSLVDKQEENIAVITPVREKHREPLLIENVRVLDFEKKSFSQPASILIKNGYIELIGNTAKVSTHIKRVDAKGRYAIPGLFDMHIHMGTPIHFVPARDVSNTSALMQYGVTSVRDLGSDINILNAWNDRRMHYDEAVPRIFSGGAMVEAKLPLFFHGGSLFAHSEEDAREIVRQEKRDGAMAIKSYFTLPWPLQRVIADEARKQQLPVASHGLLFKETVLGIILGRSTIEHQVTPTRVYGDVLSFMAKSGTRWDATVGVAGGNGLLFAKRPEMLKAGTLLATTSHRDHALSESADVFKDLSPEAIMQSYKGLQASLKQARDTGVTVLAGTDALNPNTFYGHSVHMELLHQAGAGIPNIDLLKMATLEAAKAVGADKYLGSLETGKLADIVLLNENPLDNIANSLSIWKVIFDGRVVID